MFHIQSIPTIVKFLEVEKEVIRIPLDLDFHMQLTKVKGRITETEKFVVDGVELCQHLGEISFQYNDMAIVPNVI